MKISYSITDSKTNMTDYDDVDIDIADLNEFVKQHLQKNYSFDLENHVVEIDMRNTVKSLVTKIL